MAPELMLELARRAAELVVARIRDLPGEPLVSRSSTLLHKTFALRLCIVNHSTTWDDVRATLQAAERFGREAADADTFATAGIRSPFPAG